MTFTLSRTYIPAPRADMVVPRLDRLVAFTAAERSSSLNELFPSTMQHRETERA